MADTKNVAVGKPKVGGAIYVAPYGTALPTDSTSQLSEAYKSLGYISEDGLTNENTPESESIKAWGGDTVLVVSTEKPDTFTFKLIEILNVEVLKMVYGAENVTGTLETGITVKANAKPLPRQVMVVEMILQDAIKRIVVSQAQVKEISEIEYTDEDAVGYEITVEALADADGNTHIEYIKKQGAVSNG